MMIIQKYIFLFLSKNLSYDPLLRTILAQWFLSEASCHYILYGEIGKLSLLPLLTRSTDTLTLACTKVGAVVVTRKSALVWVWVTLEIFITNLCEGQGAVK